ncbi:hypothetical protein DKT77_06985 [Meridianimarinicoccus roseus]|uniref:Uncharacterized protein n=1 Tax=Meridianimarinicoccus roseus TaxID=2072018 RepID=A0A2V2LCZ8_9RHOB|nr:hypothetical protein [Meridianimarinicoccus roseus]PWR03368.1 hypothetical protein DKT77_06985 [Meridianimarinicoccus roseus]
MAIIQTSNKLSLRQEEYCICSEPYVFFRLISDRDGVRLMTATASEDTGEYRVFGNQASLISATSRAFEDRNLNYATKKDQMGRAYIETSVYPDKDDLLHLAATVLDQIGFEDISVLALREMKAIYDEFSVGDSGEYTYLSGGMWITSDGRLIEK